MGLCNEMVWCCSLPQPTRTGPRSSYTGVQRLGSKGRLLSYKRYVLVSWARYKEPTMQTGSYHVHDSSQLGMHHELLRSRSEGALTASSSAPGDVVSFHG